MSVKVGRPSLSLDNRMMLHAIVQSWSCSDPYTANGAVLAVKDEVRATASGYLLGDSTASGKITWDDPAAYDYFVPAEVGILKSIVEKIVSFDTILYISSVPHPNSLKTIFDREIKKVVYLPVRPSYVPKNYLKYFSKLTSLYHNAKVEKYNSNLHWLMDRMEVFKNQNLELF